MSVHGPHISCIVFSASLVNNEPLSRQFGGKLSLAKVDQHPEDNVIKAKERYCVPPPSLKLPSETDTVQFQRCATAVPLHIVHIHIQYIAFALRSQGNRIRLAVGSQGRQTTHILHTTA